MKTLKTVPVELMRLTGKILCAMGLHDAKFCSGCHVSFRPHFYCRRKGCTYFKS
jgi:hypothetical protein